MVPTTVNSFIRRRVTLLCLSCNVVNNWTVTSVLGQYIDVGLTRMSWSIPASPKPMHWVVMSRVREPIVDKSL
jgi:hypothetical protein